LLRYRRIDGLLLGVCIGDRGAGFCSINLMAADILFVAQVLVRKNLVGFQNLRGLKAVAMTKR